MYEKRKKISDLALAVALLGIVLMVVETELTMANVYTKVSKAVFLIVFETEPTMANIYTKVCFGSGIPLDIFFVVIETELYYD